MVPFLKKRMTHKFGWMALLPSGQTYNWYFANADQITNITYYAKFYGFKVISSKWKHMILNKEKFSDQLCLGACVFVHLLCSQINTSSSITTSLRVQTVFTSLTRETARRHHWLSAATRTETGSLITQPTTSSIWVRCRPRHAQHLWAFISGH